MTVGNDYPEIYSLDEREVGVWIDGKPLYQKIISVTITTNASSGVPYDFSDDTLDHVENASIIGIFSDAMGFSDGFSSKGQSSQSAFYVDADPSNTTYGKLGGYSVRSDHLNHTFYAVVQYTKTTDTPGSGKWSTSGAPSHHYSQSEQVVGTWIDGKPIYEKTYYIESLPNNTTLQIETLVNINKVISFQGFCSYTLSDGYFRPIPLPDGNNDIRADVTDNVLQIKTTTNWSQYEGYLTIQYTKTTD